MPLKGGQAGVGPPCGGGSILIRRQHNDHDPSRGWGLYDGDGKPAYPDSNHGWDVGRAAIVGTPERKAAQRALNEPYRRLLDEIDPVMPPKLSFDSRAALTDALQDMLDERGRAIKQRDATANTIATLNHRIAMIERDLA